MDIRFMRRASVGLMVRAPRPVAWGTMDIRFAVDEGVVAVPVVLLPGVRGRLAGDRALLASPGVSRDPCCCWVSRDRGCRDFAFIERVARFVDVGCVFCVRSRKCEVLSTLGFRVEILGRRFVVVSLRVSVGKIPGPMDLRGGRLIVVVELEVAELVDGSGAWLRRRARVAGAEGGAIDASVDTLSVEVPGRSLWRRIEFDLVDRVADALAQGLLDFRVICVALPSLLPVAP